MSNRTLKYVVLSAVAVLLLVQVVEQQHLHINEPTEFACEFCLHADGSDALSSIATQPSISTNTDVLFAAAVSAALATKRWVRQTRAPPYNS